MRNVMMIGVLLMLMFCIPALAEEQAAKDLLGKWHYMTVNRDGEDVDVSEKKQVIHFKADGSLTVYKADKVEKEGWYVSTGEGAIETYRDANNNGKLDEEEKAKAISMTWTRSGKNVTLNMKLASRDTPVIIKTVMVED